MLARNNSPYKGSLTREQFLFFEMRTTAKLMVEGLTDGEIRDRIVEENLFQNPTERTLANLANVCIRRLHALEDEALIEAIASQPFDVSKQICLYAVMKHQRLVWDFMVTVIGEKYRTLDMSFSRKDISVFITSLQEQDDYVASWSDQTVNKIIQVIRKMLIETGYLDDIKADHINPVWLAPILEESIRKSGNERALVAFNCL